MAIFIYDTDIGKIGIEEKEDKIIGIYFENEIKVNTSCLQETKVIKEAYKQLDEYINKKRKIFDLPLNLIGTEFQIKVWKELQNIPYGETITYKQLAGKIGNVNSCRAVGNANNHNPISIVVPCHRVIGSNGKLVGYAGGLHVKSSLLEIENIKL